MPADSKSWRTPSSIASSFFCVASSSSFSSRRRCSSSVKRLKRSTSIVVLLSFVVCQITQHVRHDIFLLPKGRVDLHVHCALGDEMNVETRPGLPRAVNARQALLVLPERIPQRVVDRIPRPREVHAEPA